MSSAIEKETLTQLYARYQQFIDRDLQLDLTRGKPSKAQLSLSDRLLDPLDKTAVVTDKLDYRNYSLPKYLTGTDEAKTLFAEILNVRPENVIIGGNSSLNLMYDTIIRALVLPLPNALKSWSAQGKVKFLCPVPGYDRHFAICESLGIEMIPVPLTGAGPDMNIVESLVVADPHIKGMWCVPQYSNPTGETYSDETVDRLASMKTAADNFRIFWDNAYAVHHFDVHHPICVKDILEACRQAKQEDRVFLYGSTSKITYAGAGISAIAAHENNYNWLKTQLGFQTIGFDKLNQLRHVQQLKDKAGIMQHMAGHAAILKPKFDLADRILTESLGENGEYANWSRPKGGYFISFNTREKLAKNVVLMAEKAGVKLTRAGATFPYDNDPKDCNIRIAPSFVELDALKTAIEILGVVTKIATLEQGNA